MLKVPHHGSRYQDLDFLRSLGARVALVSVGADNDYGHPVARHAARRSSATGARVLRTDLDGDLAVVERGGELRDGHHPVSRRAVAGLAAPWQAPQQHPAPQTSSAASPS